MERSAAPQVTGQSPQTTPVTQIGLQQTTLVGPIPPPEVLEGYERLHPGATREILALAERQAAHRQEQERQRLDMDRYRLEQDVAITTRGQWFALTVAIFFGLISAILIYTGHDSIRATTCGAACWDQSIWSGWRACS